MACYQNYYTEKEYGVTDTKTKLRYLTKHLSDCWGNWDVCDQNFSSVIDYYYEDMKNYLEKQNEN